MLALLQSWRCTVIAANGAEAALARLRQSNQVPDVLLADYHLDNDATGLQALSAIQALYPRPLPAVIITADRSDEMQSAVRDAGYHLLNKPLKPARLRSLLAHLATDKSPAA